MAGTTNEFSFDGFTLNPAVGELSSNTQSIKLTATETSLMVLFIEHKDKLVSKKELMTFLWANGAFIDKDAIEDDISRLRHKLGQVGLKDRIKTVPMRGYKLVTNR
ncbi:winged helix-turn-helix domain-containing protein [Fructilactobacillus fructivorans]|uniref:Two-component response regulator n=1 Tax=Fructilactobacillus fructivorans TaxID=1614 RepID=A0A0C1PNC2_9LACO|nr:winged helix-turn-helix domain-containing protein [Fructilactobacillus fructivorans]KID42222.1 Two-component response regulator [Fructilactobacillus fructivorans]